MGRGVRAVFFDAGYTLLCMEPEQRINFVQTCAQLGIDIQSENLDKAVDLANALFAPRAAEEFPIPYSKESIDNFWVEYNRVVLTACAADTAAAERAADVYQGFLERLGWRVYDDVAPLLAELRARGIALGIISNWTGDLEDVLRAVDLRHAFDVVIDSAHFGYEKPHAEIFREATQRAGVRAADALHVGDSPEHDVEGALAFGMRAALLDRIDRYPGYDRVPRLRALTDLLDML